MNLNYKIITRNQLNLTDCISERKLILFYYNKKKKEKKKLLMFQTAKGCEKNEFCICYVQVLCCKVNDEYYVL